MRKYPHLLHQAPLMLQYQIQVHTFPLIDFEFMFLIKYLNLTNNEIDTTEKKN